MEKQKAPNTQHDIEEKKFEWRLKVSLSGVFKEQQEVRRVEWKGRIPKVKVKHITEAQILQTSEIIIGTMALVLSDR